MGFFIATDEKGQCSASSAKIFNYMYGSSSQIKYFFRAIIFLKSRWSGGKSDVLHSVEPGSSPPSDSPRMVEKELSLT